MVDINIGRQGNQLFCSYNLANLFFLFANEVFSFFIVDSNIKTNFKKTIKLQLDFTDYTNPLAVILIIYVYHILKHYSFLI